MMTNLLALPLVSLAIEVGNNEDWVDAIVFVIGLADPTAPQLDIHGIDFEMEIRHQPEDHEVVLSASTDAGTLQIGMAPNYGFLIINIPYEVDDTTKSAMKNQQPGDYVGEIRGSDGLNTRVCAQIDLTINDGVVR
jgi:hypothetical protein